MRTSLRTSVRLHSTHVVALAWARIGPKEAGSCGSFFWCIRLRSRARGSEMGLDWRCTARRNRWLIPMACTTSSTTCSMTRSGKISCLSVTRRPVLKFFRYGGEDKMSAVWTRVCGTTVTLFGFGNPCTRPWVLGSIAARTLASRRRTLYTCWWSRSSRASTLVQNGSASRRSGAMRTARPSSGTAGGHTTRRQTRGSRLTSSGGMQCSSRAGRVLSSEVIKTMARTNPTRQRTGFTTPRRRHGWTRASTAMRCCKRMTWH
mmetsp:Transcript_41425/g.84692  ORF Transcript_41425/g.84692 Transcript_41425/m.84692 type:complete len:261 (+) Transcript_41425:339-1121(+)